MAQYLEIHPTHPQPRLINQAITVLRDSGVIAYPTDSAYALGCQIGDKEPLERIKQLRQLDKEHNFTLMCRDLSDLGSYAQVSNAMFRILKANTPGAYTFILPATHEVPRSLQHPKRRTIGVRIPDNAISLAILQHLAQPMLSVSLILPGESLPLADPAIIYERLYNRIDLVVDGGFCGLEPTTVVDLTSDTPKLIRQGKADAAHFLGL